MFRVTLTAAMVASLHTGVAVAQIPETTSPAQVLLEPPAVEVPAEECGNFARRPGWYSAGGVLVAPPMLFDATEGKAFGVLPPIPAPWATLGFRRASDVSWQTSFLLVPLVDLGRGLIDNTLISTVGLDVDRISTNCSSNPEWDVRWQAGLRVVGIGFNFIPLPLAIGPHLGLRWEHPLRESLSAYGWGDFGLLPSVERGIPLADFRGELGLSWRPPSRPRFLVSVAAFNEYAGILVAGFMTPGIKFRLAWNF